MSNEFTLESLQEEIEREYAPLVFKAAGEEFVLRSLLRVPKKDREKVIAAMTALDNERENADEDDTVSEDTAVETVELIIKTVTADGKGTKLVKLLGGDVLVLMKVLQKWTEATQPGEAQNSPA
ncbi:phage tail assembly protein [Saccharopolyspora indica]|uniref:phage tail assembly protein n=1 Tax=Saccharopolyspora indica TaxID=1229659 RepID=UPI0022EACA30|nr:phage tail assembly protein [Saccharopolyspora indica]MDA3643780.1 phage tail assembly protein [Saccharopolyspora indica]